MVWIAGPSYLSDHFDIRDTVLTGMFTIHTSDPCRCLSMTPRFRPVPAGFVRGGVLQRTPLSPSTFVPPPSAPAPPPVSGRPPVPTKSRLKQKPRKVLSHYANPAEITLPDYHQSAPHMGQYTGRYQHIATSCHEREGT